MHVCAFIKHPSASRSYFQMSAAASSHGKISCHPLTLSQYSTVSPPSALYPRLLTRQMTKSELNEKDHGSFTSFNPRHYVVSIQNDQF